MKLCRTYLQDSDTERGVATLVRQKPRGIELDPAGVSARLLEEDFNGLVELLGGFVRPTDVVDCSTNRRRRRRRRRQSWSLLVADVLCLRGCGNGDELGRVEADRAVQVLVHVEGGQRLVCVLGDEEHSLDYNKR